MNKELGVWTYQDCALVLIDYQKEMFDSIRSETKAALADLNVRLLAKTAKAFGMCRSSCPPSASPTRSTLRRSHPSRQSSLVSGRSTGPR